MHGKSKVFFVVLLMCANGMVGCKKTNVQYCERDEDCNAGYGCNQEENRCYRVDSGVVDGDVDEGGVQECDNSSDCTRPHEPICDEVQGECRGCAGPAECEAEYPDRPYCLPNGACGECEDSARDCGGVESATSICSENGTCEPCTYGATGNQACEDAYGEGHTRCSQEGMCVECVAHGDCPDETASICDADKTCRPCESNPECAERNSALPYCEDNRGICVECLTNANCPAAHSPVCDGDVKACRGCESHDECNAGSGLCEFSTGECMSVNDVVYVDCSAGVMGSGTWTDPYRNLQAAIDAVKDGDGPYVRVTGVCGPVRIEGVAEINIYGKDGAVLIGGESGNIVDIVYESTDPAGTVGFYGLTISGSVGGFGIGLNCSGVAGVEPTVKLEEVTIANAGGMGVRGSRCYMKIRGSTVSGSGSVGVFSYDGVVDIEGSEVNGSGAEGIFVNSGDLEMKRTTVKNNQDGGVYTYQSGAVILWSNMIVDNGTDSSEFGGLSLHATSGVTIEFWNNTVVGNVNGGDATAMECGGGITLNNSIFWGDGPLLNSDCLPHYSFLRYDDGGGAKEGCIISDDLSDVGFLDYDGKDYRIGEGSVCIDAGTMDGLPAEMTLDIEGKDRVKGGGIDMGAHEAM